MPQNMQKKPKSVASLALDDESEAIIEDAKTDTSTTSALHEVALRYLERGMNQRKIADALVQQGVSRPQATEVAREVWKKNLSTRSQNTIILFGAGAFFIVLGLVFLLPRTLNGEGLPPFSPSYLMMLFGVYLAYRGYLDRREIQ